MAKLSLAREIFFFIEALLTIMIVTTNVKK
jgi:hypothetical protein